MTVKTIKLLAEQIHKNRRAIWDWHLHYAKKVSPPFYSSVDLRDSGNKIVPVDCNLFPAGFNNICPEDLRVSPNVFRAQIEAIFAHFEKPVGNKVLLLPESHTHNSFYIENLYYLSKIIADAGFEVLLGWYGPIPEGQTTPIRLLSATQKELSAHPIQIDGTVIRAGEFIPDFILLNNDFSSGYPAELDKVTQPIFPSYVLGWHSRKKSDHFHHYNRLATEFAEILKVDPWLITIDSEEVSPVDFDNPEATERVARAVERVLGRTKAAYESNKIQRKPFVFVKNNAGTYGMGITVVHSPDEIRKMNRRTKNKMSVGKNQSVIDSLIIQEGIPTATLIDRLAAEPVIYLLGYQLIGGFLRTNTQKGDEDNLNSQGMVFKKLCMSDLRNPDQDEDDEEPKKEPMLELVYGSIARISALAAGFELANHPLRGTHQ